MENSDFKTTIERIVEVDSRYAEEAYDFVNQALLYTAGKLKDRGTKGPKHVTGKELLLGVSEYALEQYGPLARHVLNNWGLNDGLAIGHVVFNMIDQKLLQASDNDTIEDFNVELNFDEVFEKPFKPTTKNSKNIKPPIIA